MAIRDRIVKALRLPAGSTTQTAEQIAATQLQSGLAGTPLERDPQDAIVPFAPNQALWPAFLNQPRPDGRADPRRYQYPVAWNIQITEQRVVPFQLLRDIAEQADIVRKCVETNKSIIAGLKWDITLSDDAVRRVMDEQQVGQVKAAKIARDTLMPDITAAKDFWRMPDRINGMTWQEWIMLLIEEVMVIDALSIYPNRTVDNKNLHSLVILDGATIKPLINEYGNRPHPPFPAYQQIIYGYPRGEFTASADADGEFTADDLVYAPRWRRANTPYGYSPVEKSLPVVDLYLKRQQWLRTEYTDGVTPDVFLKADDQFGNNAQLLRQFEAIFNDDLSGNMEQRRRARLIPNGFEPHFPPSVDSKFSSEYDEYLIKQICGHFGVLPSQIGVVPREGLGGKGHQDGEANSAETIGIRPVVEWIGELCSQLSYRFLGMPKDLKFVLTDGTEDDEFAQATRRQLEFFSGQKPLNEIRSEMGATLYSFPEADQPMVMAGSMLTPVAAAFEAVAATPDLVDDPDTEEVEAEAETKALELTQFIKWSKGSRNRAFVFKSVAPDLADQLNALASADADAARHLAATLRKQGGNPKVRKGREPFPPNHPARIASDKLVEIYTDKFASLGVVNTETIADEFLSLPDGADAHQWVNRNVELWGERGVALLKDLYWEAGWMGHVAAKRQVKTARERMKSPMAIGDVDWDNWTPGNPDAAQKLFDAAPGFRGLLADAGKEIKGIEDNYKDRIANSLAIAALEGRSPLDAARDIEALIGSRERAEMIAHTEMAIANAQATVDTYTEMGVSHVDWETSGDADVCEDCQANEAGSPYLLDEAPEAPAHPNCGCQLSPSAFDSLEENQLTPDEQAFADEFLPLDSLDGFAAGEAHANVNDQPQLVSEAEVESPSLTLPDIDIPLTPEQAAEFNAVKMHRFTESRLTKQYKSEGFTYEKLGAPAEAVREYQGSSLNINDYLRGTRDERLAPLTVTEIMNTQRTVEAIDAALKAAPPTTETFVVKRGVDGKYAEQLSQLKVGDQFSDSAFVSTSADTKWTWGDNITLDIVVPEGNQIISMNSLFGEYSRHPIEKEVLLPRNTRFEVVGIVMKSYGGDSWMTGLKVVVRND